MSSTFTRGNVCYRSWFWSLLGQTKSVCAAFTHCLWQALKCTSSRYSKCFAYGWKMNKKKNLTEQYTLTLFEELQQMKFAKLRCCSYMQCKKFNVDYLFDNELFWWIVGKKRCSSIHTNLHQQSHFYGCIEIWSFITDCWDNDMIFPLIQDAAIVSALTLCTVMVFSVSWVSTQIFGIDLCF